MILKLRIMNARNDRVRPVAWQAAGHDQGANE